MKCRSQEILLAALLGFAFGPVFAGPQDIEKHEAAAVQLSSRLDSLQSVHTRLADEAELLAGQIHASQEKEMLSPGQHRLLEKQLQRSQVLDNRAREVEAERESVRKQYKQILGKLIPQYQAEIENTIRQLEKETDSKARETGFMRYQDFLRKKQYRESELSAMESVSHAAPDITVKPSDTSRELRMKGDLRTDQAEALQKEIQTIESRVVSLKKEELVRKKADELSMNMHMFNEREELLGRETTRDDKRYLEEKTDVTIGYSDKSRTHTQIEPSPAGYGLEAGAKQDNTGNPDGTSYQTLSDLQETILQLNALKIRLQTKARAYQEEARKFYQTAEERER